MRFIEVGGIRVDIDTIKVYRYYENNNKLLINILLGDNVEIIELFRVNKYESEQILKKLDKAIEEYYK